MFLCVLLSYPGQSSSLDHVNSGYIRDVMFRVIYKLKQARLQATLSSHRRVQRFFPLPLPPQFWRREVVNFLFAGGFCPHLCCNWIISFCLVFSGNLVKNKRPLRWPKYGIFQCCVVHLITANRAQPQQCTWPNYQLMIGRTSMGHKIIIYNNIITIVIVLMF